MNKCIRDTHPYMFKSTMTTKPIKKQSKFSKSRRDAIEWGLNSYFVYERFTHQKPAPRDWVEVQSMKLSECTKESSMYKDVCKSILRKNTIQDKCDFDDPFIVVYDDDFTYLLDIPRNAIHFVKAVIRPDSDSSESSESDMNDDLESDANESDTSNTNGDTKKLKLNHFKSDSFK